MKKSELRKIIKEELQAVLREKEEEVELSSDEQKIFDDIIGEGLTEAEVDFKDILSKVKRYAKKGVLTVAILAKLTSPTLGFTSDQVKDITQIANTEMQAETMKQIQKDVSYKDLVKMAKEENWDGAPGRTMMKSWMKDNKKTASFTIIRTVGSTESGAWRMATSVAKANKINPIKFQTSNVGKFVGELSNGNVVVAYVIPNASF